MSIDLSQFHTVFFDEAAEHLAAMESKLLELDLSNPDLEDLNAIFRSAHSIKGGAGTFGFSDMTEITHVAETLLDHLRHGALAPTREMVDALLAAKDVIQDQLQAHQAGSPLPADAVEQVKARLAAFSGNAAARAPAAKERAALKPLGDVEIRFHAPADDAAAPDLLATLGGFGEVEVVAREPLGKRRRRETVPNWHLVLRNTAAEDAEIRALVDFVMSPSSVSLSRPQADAEAAGSRSAVDAGWGLFEPEAAPVGAAPVEAAAGTPEDDVTAGFGFFGDAPGAPPPAPGQQVVDAAPAEVERAPGRRATDKLDFVSGPAGRREHDRVLVASGGGDASSIRVSVEKVDQLINLVGELVITQSILAQAAAEPDLARQEALRAGIDQLARNSRDLQEAVMSIRMLPIAFVFSRFPRVVRDLAGKLGKAVELVTVGEQTELDKGVIEKLADPLTHLVRNSLDHGLETSEQRIAAGKPPTGTVTLRAGHQGGSIVIEVIDDGRGLDRARILAKARERGMRVDDAMSDAEVFALVFEPGFSTAAEITDVSGRGVGMDVVRRNIQSMGGRVEIASRPGQGSSITIRLPLTLAILDGISVSVGEELFIVPLTAIVESLQPSATDIRSVAGQGEVMQVRGEYLPVVRLHQVMGLTPREYEYHRGIMVITEAHGGRIALFVDALVGQHQVVIKSLESNYRKVRGISAATIMGDGKVAMILDAGELVRMGTSAPALARAA
jgi:two-component system chemotaxis sensor kinase CheA